MEWGRKVNPVNEPTEFVFAADHMALRGPVQTAVEK
jgi:hypothetical protein